MSAEEEEEKGGRICCALAAGGGRVWGLYIYTLNCGLTAMTGTGTDGRADGNTMILLRDFDDERRVASDEIAERADETLQWYLQSSVKSRVVRAA